MKSSDTDIKALTERIIAGVPEGLDALVLAQLVAEAQAEHAPGTLLHVARDDRRLDALERALAFFAPNVRVISFPAWDTVPYDRIGPNAEIVARRIAALAKLALGARKHPTVVLTTVNAILQRLAPRAFLKRAIKQVAAGQRIDMGRLTQQLALMGYVRSGTVMEPGEYAVRGGIVDLFPPGRASPVRLDFFGDTLESIKAFEVQTQRTARPVQKLAILPVSEVAFGADAEKLFRARYVELFGGATGDDPLYEAISAGQRYPGQEHWLPLFHEQLETLFDYLPGVPVSFDHLSDEAATRRFEQIAEHYDARTEALEEQTFGAPPYKPVPPERLFLDATSWGAALKQHNIFRLTPFEEAAGPNVRSWRGRGGRSFAAERQQDVNVFDAVVAHAKRLHAEHRRVIVAAWTPGARERLATLLADHGLKAGEQGRDLRRGLGASRIGDGARRLGAGAGLRDAGARRHRRAGHSRRPPGAPAAQAALGHRRPHRGDEPVGRRPRRARRSRHRALCRLENHHGARRPARLPGAALRRRRQAVPAGREHRAVVALRCR